MNEATLTAAELGFLLSTLDAPAVVGVEQDVVNPQDRETVFMRGLEELKQHGWLVPGEEPGRENLSVELMLMVECATIPRISLLVERADPDGHRRAVYYLTDPETVELVETPDGGFRLSNIGGIPVVIGRVLESLEWPEAETESAGISLTQEDFTQISTAEKSGDRTASRAKLMELGLTESAANEFLDTFSQADHKGTIAVNRHQQHAIAEAFFVAMFVRGPVCWGLYQPVEAGAALRLARMTEADAADQLRAYLAHFLKS